MKLGIMVLGLFILIALFLFVWYHVEQTQNELEQLNKQRMEEP